LLAELKGHAQGVNDELARDVLAHTPADHLPTEQVDHHGQEQPTYVSGEAKRAGLLQAIKAKWRDGQETTEEDAALEELAIHSPVPVAVPRLLYADATPEALSHALATGWPSAALLSAEAGAVFGAHGMG
jgi:hypothetical protein